MGVTSERHWGAHETAHVNRVLRERPSHECGQQTGDG